MRLGMRYSKYGAHIKLWEIYDRSSGHHVISFQFFSHPITKVWLWIRQEFWIDESVLQTSSYIHARRFVIFSWFFGSFGFCIGQCTTLGSAYGAKRRIVSDRNFAGTRNDLFRDNLKIIRGTLS